ncbi:MAG: hypothetical protein KAH20_13020 [Methylococcales bacterium]|nr:hypothetical protein [Methylococcales bacterium]
MSSSFNYLKSIFLILSTLWSIASFAENVTWQLSFIDSQNELVGNGQFTYDPTTTERIEPLTSDAFEVTSLVDSISIELDDKEWGTAPAAIHSSGILWWDNPRVVTPGSHKTIRFTTFLTEEWEFVNNELERSSALIMQNFTSILPRLWVGVWRTSEFTVEKNTGIFIITPLDSSNASLPTFSGATGIVNIPEVIVDQASYSVKMKLNPNTKPTTFTLTEINTKTKK